MPMLVAYDADGRVIATLDHAVARTADGRVVGLLDFEAHEDAGGRLREVWEVPRAVGSGTWPEWLGGRAHDFRVELDGTRIVALVHARSGNRRELMAIKAAVAAVEPDDRGARDIRHLVGGPGRPLLLDDDGLPQGRPEPAPRPDLPVILAEGLDDGP